MPTPTPSVTPSGAAPSSGSAVRRPRRRWRLGLLVLLLVPLALLVAYVQVALRWSYSEGERAGYVQKFSRKGWICKTWEGELAMASIPGSMPELFAFTVRDDAVAARINQSMGQRVALSYGQHRGLPTSCFGETEYFVTGVRPVTP
jgi:hypothetical protein